MSKRLSQLADDKCDLEMTPMIDVVFLLLIFFMCTLKFKTLEGKLSAYLPKDVGVNQDDAEPIEKVEIIIHVKKGPNDEKMTGIKLKPGNPPVPFTSGMTGRFQWNTEELASKHPSLKNYPTRVLWYRVGVFTTEDLGELEDRVRQIREERQPLMPTDPATGKPKLVPATIDSRADTVYEDVADMLDVVIEAGFEEVTFVGNHGDNID
jgi:biopolymer transport protein ExbD